MNDNVEFFKELNKFNIFDIKLNDIAPQNFRIMTNDHVFPEFKLNQHFGLNTIMTKISAKSFNEYRITKYLNNLKELQLYDKSDSGLIFFGIFMDKNNDLYACLSSQLDQADLIKFYHIRALEETTSNLEVRFNLLKKAYDPSILPETYMTLQQEYDELRQCKLSYLYANRFNYLESLKDEAKLSMETNLHLLNDLCKFNNLTTLDGVMMLNHVTIKDDFLHYFVTELHNQSLIFYNLQEGFGLIENNNDTAFLIPTVSFSNRSCIDELNIHNVNIYESSVLSRRNYNPDRFLSRDLILNNIDTYAKTLNLSGLGIHEVNHFIPQFLYLI